MTLGADLDRVEMILEKVEKVLSWFKVVLDLASVLERLEADDNRLFLKTAETQRQLRAVEFEPRWLQCGFTFLTLITSLKQSQNTVFDKSNVVNY